MVDETTEKLLSTDSTYTSTMKYFYIFGGILFFIVFMLIIILILSVLTYVKIKPINLIN